MYDDSMEAIHTNLIEVSNKRKLTFTAEIHPKRLAHNNQMCGVLRRPMWCFDIHLRRSWVRSLKQDHLVCFLGGSLMLGATTAGAIAQPVSVPPTPEELSPVGQRDWTTGVNLIETCVDTYRTATYVFVCSGAQVAQLSLFFQRPSARDRALQREDRARVGLVYQGREVRCKRAGCVVGPDHPFLRPPGEEPVYDARYILRFVFFCSPQLDLISFGSPETVESLFLAWRLTGNPRYRAYGWEIFQAIETHCRVESGGYASVLNVEEVPVTWEDKMETFLMVRAPSTLLCVLTNPFRRARRSSICTYYSRIIPYCR